MREQIWRVARWLEGATGERRLFWPVAAAWGVLSFLATIGLITGGVALGVAISVVLVLYLCVIVLVLLASRQYLTSDLRAYSRVLNRYSDKTRIRQQRDPALFTISNWDEDVIVDRHGDAHIRRWFDLKVGQSESIDCFWTLASRNSDQDLSPRQQERVRVTAHYFDSDKTVGARYRVTRQWEQTRFLRIFVHLDRDFDPGSDLRVLVEIKWPKYYSDLIHGDTEEFSWTFRRLTAAMKAHVVFDKRFMTGSYVVTPFDEAIRPVIIKGESGSTSIEFAVTDIQPDETFGYTLDIAR